jgi:hypothetical protein
MTDKGLEEAARGFLDMAFNLGEPATVAKRSPTAGPHPGRRQACPRRTLVRRFREETGSSPVAWLTGARLEHARELLELTDVPVEHLGRLTGLGSPASVRAIFHRLLALTPRVPGDVPLSIRP